MSISKEEVKYIADLAKLKFNEKEIDKLSEDLSSIVAFAEELNEVNIEGIKPTDHILNVKNVFREDNVKESLDRKEILKNAPEKEIGCVVVPKTVD